MAYVNYPVATKEAMIETLLEQIEQGKSMREVCRQDGMVDHTTVIRWMRDDAALATRYARARVAQADVLFDRMEEVEEDVKNGVMESHAARVVLDSMRWRAAKLAPKVYGERIDVEVTDSRISIRGALQDAQHRLATVIDVTPKGGVGADEGGGTVADTP
jgi:transposase-like protein